MDNRPNLSSIKDYAERFATVVCDDFYNKELTISGKQIMHFSTIKQVNLFVVKAIFEEWQEETVKLQSPFFSYEKLEVKKALGNLMNALSKSISIKREHIEPVLIQAVVDTLILTFSPTEYLYQLFRSYNKKITLQEEITPILKYIKIHPNLIPKIFDKIDEEGNIIKRKNAIKICTEYILNHPKDIDDPFDVVYEFDQVLPIEITKIAPNWKTYTKEDELKLDNKKATGFSKGLFDIETLEEEQFGSGNVPHSNKEKTEVNEKIKPTEETKVTNLPKGKEGNDTSKNEELSIEKEIIEDKKFDFSKVVSDALSDNIEEIIEDEKRNIAQVKEEIIEEIPSPQLRKVEMPNIEEVSKSIVKEFKYNEQKKTEIVIENPITEPIKKKGISHKRTKSLKEIIPKSSESIFTKELFGGSQHIYMEAINMIEDAADYHAAVIQLRRKYVVDYDWDLTSDTTIDFLSMVDKSF